MIFKKLFCSLKKFWSKFFNKITKKNSVLDTISLKLFGLKIKVTRELPIDIPHELTVVVPRAEYRDNYSKDSREFEILLNSITIAHSPRFEPINRHNV